MTAWPGSVMALHIALGPGAADVDLHQPPLGEVVGDPEGDGDADARCRASISSRAPAWLWKIRCRSSGTSKCSEQAAGDAVVLGGGRAEQPQLLAQRLGADGPLPSSWPGPDDHGQLVARNVWCGSSDVRSASLGPIAMSTARVVSRDAS